MKEYCRVPDVTSKRWRTGIHGMWKRDETADPGSQQYNAAFCVHRENARCSACGSNIH